MMSTSALEQIAAGVVRPAGAHTVVLVEAGTIGGRLPTGQFSGIGGTTAWGPAWFDGLRKGKPVHLFDNHRDAATLADILDGRDPALRSAPHSAADRQPDRGLNPAAVELTGGPARGAVQSVGRDARSPSRRPVAAAAAHRLDDAAPSPASSAVERVGAVPGGITCKACGRDLSELARSRTGQRRQTCDDACRQAFARGQRAPVPGVVDAEDLTRLSRLSRPSDTGTSTGPTPELDAQQLDLVVPATGSA